MEVKIDNPRPGLLIPLRLASYVILMGVVVFWLGYPKYLQTPVFAYSLLTLAFTVCMALEKRLNLYQATEILIVLQSLCEIIIGSGVIYATGNIHSPFSALYVLTVVSAALTFRMVGTLLIASVVSLAYTFIIWLGLVSIGNASSVQALKTLFSTDQSIFYAIFLHILIFYLTAFISGYLAERFRAQGKQLEYASKALRRARLETDDILRHLNSGLLTVDAGGSIIFFNRAAEKILGYVENRVKGMSCSDVFSERMPQLAECLMAGVKSGTPYPRKELKVVNSSKKTIPLGLSTSVLKGETDELRGVIAVFSDLTTAKQLEQKARVNDRLAAVGELSASIAHEIRNPLTAISGSVEVLQADLSLENQNARLMELIVTESRRLNKILSDFLDYARIVRPSYTKVELCKVVSDTVELLTRQRETYGDLVIDIESDESIVYVIGDEDLIRQVVMNLGLNACEAMEDRPGKVVFRIAVDSGERLVRLSVIDTGPGIEREHLDDIYTPFFSTKKKGTGLGLAVVHRICSAIQLKLKVESSAENGTTFTVQFQSCVQQSPHEERIPHSVA